MQFAMSIVNRIVEVFLAKAIIIPMPHSLIIFYPAQGHRRAQGATIKIWRKQTIIN